MLRVKCIPALLSAQQAARVPPSNRAGVSYPSVSLGIQDKELTLGSRPPGGSACVLVKVSLALCVFVSVYICLSRSMFAEEQKRRKASF